MKKLLSVFVVVAMTLFGSVNASNDNEPVLIHLSHYSNDLHAVSMALKIGGLLSKNGTDVTLFLDLEGVRLADKNQPQNLAWGSGLPIEKLYAKFVSNGGKVLVCPHCATAAGVTELREGAVIANQSALLNAITSSNKILDY